MVEIATPEIVPAAAWSDLERLNKERELVGIYLSAHPLDEFRVILEDVCNAQMAQLADLTPFQNKDLLLGGIVTAVREGYTKKGNPYGIAKVEVTRVLMNLRSLAMTGWRKRISLQWECSFSYAENVSPVSGTSRSGRLRLTQ